MNATHKYNFEQETLVLFEAIYGDVGTKCVIFTDYFFQLINQALNRILERDVTVPSRSRYHSFIRDAKSDTSADHIFNVNFYPFSPHQTREVNRVIQSLTREILCCAIECRIKMNCEKGQRAPFILDDECITRLLKENVDLASI